MTHEKNFGSADATVVAPQALSGLSGDASVAHTAGPCEAEIQNARDYLAECEEMQREFLARGDVAGKVAHIQLGFARAEAIDRLRGLERAKFRAEVARA